jgi:hypothetical protein
MARMQIVRFEVYGSGMSEDVVTAARDRGA